MGKIFWHKLCLGLLRLSVSQDNNSNKNKQMDLINLTSFCIAKETINKIMYGLGENISKQWDKVLILKYTNSSYNSTTEKEPNQKMGRRTKEVFLQRRHTDGQETYEKMLNIDIREMQINTTKR